MALKYDQVIASISKPPDRRNDFEVNNLLPWFRKKSDLFRTLKTELLFDIIKNLQFVTKGKDEVIIRQGDVGDCMYILLRGQITIYILYAAKGDGDDDRPSQPPLNTKSGGEAVRQQLGTFVTHLGAGATFGEVALMSEDCVRTASIIADDTIDLIVVDRNLYNRSVKNVLKQEFQDKTDFIATSPYFSAWPPKYKKQLAMALQKDAFPYDSMLVKQGDRVGTIYFILVGEVKLVVDPTLHKTQFSKVLDKEESITNGESKGPPSAATATIDKHDKDDLSTSKSPRSSEKTVCESGLSSKFRKKIVKRQPQEICLLGVNESIGDIEVLMDLDSYMQTAVCAQRTEVLVLELKHFERLLVKRNPRTIDAMREGLELRLRFRTSKRTDKNVPLLRHLTGRAEEYSLQRQQQTEARLHTGHDRYPTKHRSMADTFDTFVPPRGALIDIYGPGTVFHRIRQREAAKVKRQARNRGKDLFGGFHSFGGGVSNGIQLEPVGHNEYNGGMRTGSSSAVATDYETSDPVLTQLENRMRAWLSNESFRPIPGSELTTHTSREQHPRVARLQRAPAEMERVKPGAKVVLRPRELGGRLAAEEDTSVLQAGSAWV